MKAYVASPRGKNNDLLVTIDSYIKKWKDDRESLYFKSIYKWTGHAQIVEKVIPMWVKLYFPVSIFIFLFILFWAATLKHQIKKRRAVEKKLREDEKKFRYLSEAAFEGILITEKNNIVEANSATSQMFGYSETELLSKKATDLVTLEEKENIKNKISSEYENPFESRGLRKDGSTFAIEVRGKLFPYNQRQGRITAIRDISEHKKYREELKKNINDLQETLAEIKTLRGILPICATCKKIRDDKGYWNKVETYIENHSDAQFSHGLCEECSEKLYRDEKWYKELKKSEEDS